MNALEMAVIHDLKNELQSLSLKLGVIDGLGHEVNSIMAASSKLTALLLLSKSSLDDFDINVDSGSPADLINDAAASFYIDNPDVSIDVDLSSCPEIWFYDRFYVELAINNGLHNAARYAKTKIQISAYPLDGYLVIQIKDDGAGYPEFVMGANKTNAWLSASELGTGMGLRLTREIISRHTHQDVCGKLELQNDPLDGGAVFRINLP